MRRFSAIHWGLLCAAVISTVLLSFVRTVPTGSKRVPVATHNEEGVSLDQQIAEARKRLDPQLQEQVAVVESSIRTERDYIRRGQLYDSLTRILASARELVFAAWISEQKAIGNNGSGSDWQVAGERYRAAVSFQHDARNTGALYEAAMRCFNKALELEPKNSAAKIGLGICIVESTGDPMKGVGLLLEVEKEDSTNVDVQLALGDLAVQSKQFAKAVDRYNKALSLRPDLYAIHLSLADVYTESGDTASAIAHLEAYVKLETDPVTRNDIENAIQRLRNGSQQP
jgi:tetratricopeptide (TPR) repeat protein